MKCSRIRLDTIFFGHLSDNRRFYLKCASIKGGSISESFSRCLQSPKKHYPEHLLFRCIELRIVIWHIGIWGDWSQTEKLSKIKSPLPNHRLAQSAPNTK